MRRLHGAPVVAAHPVVHFATDRRDELAGLRAGFAAGRVGVGAGFLRARRRQSHEDRRQPAEDTATGPGKPDGTVRGARGTGFPAPHVIRSIVPEPDERGDMQIELGIIEGFYGRPWTAAEREETISFLAPHGYRFY